MNFNFTALSLIQLATLILSVGVTTAKDLPSPKQMVVDIQAIHDVRSAKHTKLQTEINHQLNEANEAEIEELQIKEKELNKEAESLQKLQKVKPRIRD